MSGAMREEWCPGVKVWRGEVVESFHRVRAVVVDGTGRATRRGGDVTERVVVRSVAKPFQALPLVEDGVVEALGLSTEHLALACASHGGEPRHVEGVRQMLELAGATEKELACGPASPLSPAEADRLRGRGEEPGVLHNNCSGKHAGMLALAAWRGWPRSGYHREGHPVQERMHQAVAAWVGLRPEDVATATDGCGVRTFALPLEALARAFARLGREAARGGVPGQVLGAMRSHPFLVGGSHRLCTRLGEVSGGRIVAKVGAEGMYGAWVEEPGLGIALKVEDGGRRAADPALLETLRHVGALSRGELEALKELAAPVVTNARGEAVGRLEATVFPEDGA